MATILAVLADGMDIAEILDAYPDLEAADINEALHYAAEALVDYTHVALDDLRVHVDGRGADRPPSASRAGPRAEGPLSDGPWWQAYNERVIMPWRVYTAGEQIGTWIAGLTDEQQDAVLAAIELLEEHGPALGRPIVDKVHGSRHHKMKELRPTKLAETVLRVLFAFDSERRGALLIGGDKAEEGQWNQWYDTWIPIADDLLDQIEERLTEAREAANTAKTSRTKGKKNKKGGRR